MNLLFPLEVKYPAGFLYHPDFISLQEEKYLLEEITKIELHTFSFQGFEAKRKVASFGYDYSFEKRNLSKGKDIPTVFHSLIKKTGDFISVKETEIAELLVTEYREGSMINWHRDAHPFDTIAGISLMSDCTFRLRPFDKTMQGRGSVISVPVARRSLYVMRGAVRTDWQHSISPVKHKRYSITLRTLK